MLPRRKIRVLVSSEGGAVLSVAGSVVLRVDAARVTCDIVWMAWVGRCDLGDERLRGVDVDFGSIKSLLHDAEQFAARFHTLGEARFGKDGERDAVA